MGRWSSADLVRIRDVEAELACHREGEAPALERVLDALHEVLGMESTVGNRLGPRGDGVGVEWWCQRGMRADVGRLYDHWLRGKGVNWGAYNPIRPEPRQRNVVLTLPELLRLIGKAETLATLDLFPRIGLAHRDQLRVLACEGPSLLAWVGGFQPGASTSRQKQILRRLVPALQRSLAIERAIHAHAATLAALEAAIENIGAPTFIVTPSGHVEQANLVGQDLLAHEAPSTREKLRWAASGRTATGVRSTRIRAKGVQDQFLVILEPSRRGARAMAAAAGAAWHLTRRQLEILSMVISGRTNAAIAAALGIAERTVEAHVSAMLEKAQVGSRSALVARALMGL